MQKYIVRNENKYIVEEHEKQPVNTVLYKPSGFGAIPSKHYLVDLNIEFVWKVDKPFEVLYKGQILVSYDTYHLMAVCDFINKYNAMSKEEVEEKYIKVKKQTKSTIEIEIESLTQEKNKLEYEVSIYRKIKQKREEIGKLLAQLENNKET